MVEQRKEGRDKNYRREQVKESQTQTRSRSNTQEGRGRHETCGQGGEKVGNGRFECGQYISVGRAVDAVLLKVSFPHLSHRMTCFSYICTKRTL